MKKLRVGVVGVGHLGSAHAKVYSRLKNVDLVSVCDCKLTRAKKIARKYKTSYCTDYRDLFKKVDAVSIVVPTSLHYAISKDFLVHDIHLLIEKPMTKILSEADELILLAKEKKITLQIGHIERFNSAIQAIEGFLKEPRFVECQRLGPFNKRVRDVGAVLDLMIHDIDIVLGLVKSDVLYIEAVGASTISLFEDIANVRISFENGAVADITASRVTKDRVRRIRIFQEDSYIFLDYIRQDAVMFGKKGSKIKRKKIPIRKVEPLKQELKSFVKCVTTGSRPVVAGEEGRRALAVALMIVEKINLGKKNYK
ncbi:MAG: Gfo/Idh/MocA family oxidoreductase [Candidatus Omnitrophota bacterium]